MNVSAILNNESVTIIDIDVDGTDIYVSYVDASNNLNITKKFLDPKTNYTTIATSASATIN